MVSSRTPTCFVIDKQRCSFCGLCADVCPVEAISQFRFEIDPAKCIGCGQCSKDCPCGAIHPVSPDCREKIS